MDDSDQIEFTYKEFPEYFHLVYSDELSTYLISRKKPEVELELELLYHWGVFVGHSLKSVDGKPWISGRQGGAGTRGNNPQPSPFPRYYYGLGN